MRWQSFSTKKMDMLCASQLKATWNPNGIDLHRLDCSTTHGVTKHQLRPNWSAFLASKQAMLLPCDFARGQANSASAKAESAKVEAQP